MKSNQATAVDKANVFYIPRGVLNRFQTKALLFTISQVNRHCDKQVRQVKNTV